MPDSGPGALGFPARFTPESDLAAYAAYRSEGRKISPTIRGGLEYIEKWFRKKYSAPVEELPYFDRQRAVLRMLMAEPPRDGASVRLGLVGDLMWLRNNWDGFLAEDVLAELNRCDVLLGNLESPIAREIPVPSFLPEYFHYNSDPGLLASFRRPDGRNSFTAVSIANNHVLDFGAEGCRQTLEFLEEQRVPQSGAVPDGDQPPYVAFERGGIRFGFFAAGWGVNNLGAAADQPGLRFNFLPGLAPEDGTPVDLTLAERALDAMTADNVDFKILGLHWNFEYEWYPTPQTMMVGRRLVERGADLIMGHHPHVQQPAEIAFVNGAERDYRGEPALAGEGCFLKDPSGRPRKALIIYSLGNFATKMSTFISQIGMLQTLLVTRLPSGAVDWSSPSHRLVFNHRQDPACGGRRLVFLEDYLRRSGPTPDEALQVAFVRDHLTGTSIEPAEARRLGNIGIREIATNLPDLAAFVYTSARG